MLFDKGYIQLCVYCTSVSTVVSINFLYHIHPAQELEFIPSCQRPRHHVHPEKFTSRYCCLPVLNCRSKDEDFKCWLTVLLV